MSKIHPEICPLLSRSVTFPPGPAEEHLTELGEDYLIEIDCLEDRCGWWNYNEEICSIKLIANMAWRLKEDGP